MNRIYIIYFFIINIVAIAIMYTDKKSAEHKLWRISEKNIFLISFLGGSIGVYIGMQIFRHKTKKNKFRYGMPIIIISQILLFKYIIKVLSFWENIILYVF